MPTAKLVAFWRPLQKTSLKKAKLIVGDTVRVSNINISFEKGYKQKYRNKVFKVTSVARPESTSLDLISYRWRGSGVTKFTLGFTIKTWLRSNRKFLNTDPGTNSFIHCKFVWNDRRLKYTRLVYKSTKVYCRKIQSRETDRETQNCKVNRFSKKINPNQSWVITKACNQTAQLKLLFLHRSRTQQRDCF